MPSLHVQIASRLLLRAAITSGPRKFPGTSCTKRSAGINVQVKAKG